MRTKNCKMKSILSKLKPIALIAGIALVAIFLDRKIPEKTVKEDGTSFLPAI